MMLVIYFVSTLVLISAIIGFFISFKKNGRVVLACPMFSSSFMITFTTLPWFFLGADELRELVLKPLHHKFDDIIIFAHAAVVVGLGNILLLLGVWAYWSRIPRSVLNYKVKINRFSTISFRVQIVLFVIVFVFYLLFFGGVQGVIEYVLSLNNRVAYNEGRHYSLGLMMFFISYLAFLLIIYRFRYGARLVQYFIFAILLIMLMSIGSRASLFTVIVMGVLTWNLFVNKNLRGYFLVLAGVVVLLAQLSIIMETLREGDVEKIQYTSKVDNIVELVVRLSPVRASIVTVGYFQDHSYWYGSSFSSLLYAPIPRTLYPDKPPVETGRYTKNIALGEEVDPPAPDKSLPVYSALPEGNLIYYQNFGMLYFLIVFLFGLFYSFLYYASIVNASVILLYFYLPQMVIVQL